MTVMPQTSNRTVSSVVILCESAQVKGGSEKVAVESALELRRRGIRVGFITADPVVEPELLEAGVEMCVLDIRGFFGETDKKRQLVKLFGNPDVVKPIRDFLRRFERGETVVHVHNIALILSWRALETAVDMGFKVVFTCHDYATACPTSLFYDFRKQCACPLRPLSRACWLTPCLEQGPKTRIPRLTAHYAANRSRIYEEVSAFIYVSEQARERLAPYHSRRALREVVLNPLPSRARELGNPSASRSFCYIGRMTTEKAPEDLAIAAKGAGLSAVFVGDGPLTQELRTRYPEHQFLGWLDREALVSVLKQSRAYVIPSRWEETFGLSVADAIAYGVPVIASDHVGAKELIERSGAGIVYPAGDPEALRNALLEVAGPKGDSLIKKAETAPDFDWDVAKQHDAILSIYSRVINGDRI